MRTPAAAACLSARMPPELLTRPSPPPHREHDACTCQRHTVSQQADIDLFGITQNVSMTHCEHALVTNHWWHTFARGKVEEDVCWAVVILWQHCRCIWGEMLPRWAPAHRITHSADCAGSAHNRAHSSQPTRSAHSRQQAAKELQQGSVLRVRLAAPCRVTIRASI